MDKGLISIGKTAKIGVSIDTLRKGDTWKIQFRFVLDQRQSIL